MFVDSTLDRLQMPLQKELLFRGSENRFCLYRGRKNYSLNSCNYSLRAMIITSGAIVNDYDLQLKARLFSALVTCSECYWGLIIRHLYIICPLSAVHFGIVNTTAVENSVCSNKSNHSLYFIRYERYEFWPEKYFKSNLSNGFAMNATQCNAYTVNTYQQFSFRFRLSNAHQRQAFLSVCLYVLEW